MAEKDRTDEVEEIAAAVEERIRRREEAAAEDRRLFGPARIAKAYADQAAGADEEGDDE